MLYLEIPEREYFDEFSETFLTIKAQKLQMEHSLVSLSKWESKWKKPFLDPNTQKTNEEVFDYFRCMTITQNVDPTIYQSFDREIIDKIDEYINDPMTATWFSDRANKPKSPTSSEVITAEILYYDMIALNIPLECQKWHLNRLMTLIRVCHIKSQPPEKMSPKAIMNQNRSLNSARKKARRTRG